jgi:uncharacterized protein (DUF952 family)
MATDSDPLDRIYHLALHAEWYEASASGTAYRRSTLGTTLEEQGFIHCSFADQVQQIADLVYVGRDDVVLLVIDPALVPHQIEVENLEGGDQLFPHIYGPLPLQAVVAVHAVPPGPEGRLELPELSS